jgi:hypothetical protein
MQLLNLNDFECVDVAYWHAYAHQVLSRYYSVLARLLARAPHAQVLAQRLEEGQKVGLFLGMKGVSMDYDSIGDYGETATQRESPSLPE